MGYLSYIEYSVLNSIEVGAVILGLLNIDEVSSKWSFCLAVSWRVNGTAKLLLLLLSTSLLHIEAWMICCRRGWGLLEVLVGYHVLLGSSNLTISSHHWLRWKEVHISVRKMMELLRNISRILIFFVLVASYSTDCLLKIIMWAVLTWLLCEISFSIGWAEWSCCLW